MYKLILIRFGELSLKGKNKIEFVNQLAKNIKKICKLKNEDINVKIDRIFITFSEENMNNLNYVFGISSFSPVIQIQTNLEEIEKNILLCIPKNIKTFKINSRRNWKEFKYDSLFLNKHLGLFVLNNNTNLSVDVKNPDTEINIEIHKEFTYIFFEKIKGLGGLPVGSSGSVLHLLSGGIDSPVAAFQMMKRGVRVDFLSFVSPPHTDQKTIDKIKKIVELLNNYQKNTKLYIFNYTDLMNYISLTSNQSYKIILMRRSFYRIASILANKNNNLGISNGENLGQVASQTMEAIKVIHQSASLPVYQPLLTNDKLETIELANKIKTFDISIIKACETCELFAPKKPSTKPKIEIASELENELDLLNQIENESIESKIETYFVK